ncbi:hypothetical protein Trydic_g19553 [Trypoxylus dichotomus]
MDVREQRPMKTSVLMFYYQIKENNRVFTMEMEQISVLFEDDPDHRLHFCELMTRFIKEQPNLVNQIIFSDEVGTIVVTGQPRTLRALPQNENVWAA